MQQNRLNIILAVEPDLPELMDLFRACTLLMQRNGLRNWNDEYPGESTLLQDIQTGALYKADRENKLIGAVTLNRIQPPEYGTVQWEMPAGSFLVVHRLAVHPGFQGKGYAREIMRFAESFGRKQSCSSIRMDVFSLNTPALGLYGKMNYRRAGKFYFPGHAEPFIALEKMLSSGE